MATAWTPLANITLGSGQTTVTFSSITGSYRDLVLVGNFTLSANNYPYIQFNTDTGGNYNWTEAGVSGAASSSAGLNTTYIYLDNYTGFTSDGLFELNLFDYSATDKHKMGYVRAGEITSAQVNMTSFRWANTAAITSIKLTGGLSGQTFTTGSTFALYGVSA